MAALALVTFSFGIASPASADRPEADRGNSEVAHANNADRKPEQASTKSSTTGGTTAREDVEASGRGGGSAKAETHATVGTSGTSGVATEEQPVSNADRNSGGANGQCSDTEPDAGAYCSTRDGSPSGNGQGVGKATGKPCAGCVGRADNKNPPGQLPDARADGNSGYECDDNNGVGRGKVGSKDGATSAGNPAHTGCTTPPTTAEEECPPGSTAAECVEEECPPGSTAAECVEQECPPGSTAAECVEEECPPGSTAAECVEEGECPPGSTAPECVDGENPPPTGGNPPPGPEGNPNPPVIGGEEELGAPRPPVVAGVQQFAGPVPAAAAAAAPQAGIAPQAGVLPQTGAAPTGALAALAAGLLLVGGVLVGTRRRGAVATRR